jgi:hypothetical protein
MDSTKSTNRLTQQQKALLTAAKDLNLSAFDRDYTIETVDISNFKKYMELHCKLKEVLVATNMEPHEIYTLINSYSGSFKGFHELKNFVRGRNLCIIKKIKETPGWYKQINKVTLSIRDRHMVADEHLLKLTEITNDMIYKILLKEVNTLDILQHKITLNSKNNINEIKLTPEDQKNILLELLKEKIIVKK